MITISDRTRELADEGWYFITNEDRYRGVGLKGGRLRFFQREHPLTNDEIRGIYRRIGVNEVLIDTAYDIDGREVPFCAAVYARSRDARRRRVLDFSMSTPEKDELMGK